MTNEMRHLITLCEAVDDPRRVYRGGMCDAMALALHDLTRLPLGLWRGFFPDEYGDEEDEGYEDCHAVVVISFDPPRWIDVDGVHEGEPDNCHFAQPVTRLQLVPATKQDVRDAFTMEHFKPAIVRQAKQFIAADPVLSKLIADLRL